MREKLIKRNRAKRMRDISKNNGFIHINILTRLLALGLHGKLGYLFEISMTTFSVLEHQIGRSNVLAST